ncbi:MAG: DNA gyrase subunit A [Acidobacteria bacterium]|nr:DNA gyrase subunit A [Acidobacteriota bacterium]
MEIAKRQIPINIEDEMRVSYLDYAMSVIIGRALPDIRDGLKPVHRRILYAMRELGNTHDKPYKKSARIVGDVIGKYHPHGDAAVYDSIVRMVQDFSMRYPLIDGQGNFGSVDGDSPAAMRYTEIRMGRLAEELLADIDKDTVEFQSNYDESLTEPTVLPAKFPNLLVNGASGIAVGMATNIPPHNLSEIIEATIALVDNPNTPVEKLMKIVPGPDFPTAGFIYGRSGIEQAYRTGRGIIQMRARAATEQIGKDREAIVISEIPFQVNKAKLLERIAELVREKRLEGVADLRDESDRDGMRVVVELKRGEQPQVILNNLYKMTPLQATFGVILLAIVNNQPRVLSLPECLNLFVEHRKEVVIRRTRFDLEKAEKRAHILEGLKKALEHLDGVITLIRSSKTPPEARDGLMKKYDLTRPQAEAILEMRLQRLTGLERDKIIEEYEETLRLIAQLKEILGSERVLKKVISEELREIQKAYGDERRTTIVDEEVELTLEDLIVDENVVITATHSGYIKRTAAHVYRSQHRGGKGRIGMTARAEDLIDYLFVASTHAYMLIFTNRGRVYWLKVYEIPDVGAAGKGKAIINLINIGPGEKIADMIAVREFSEGHYVVMATRRGVIKKTELTAFSNPRSSGIIAMSVDESDELIVVKQTGGEHDIFLATRDGLAIRFPESEVRDMGRAAFGVRGIRLREGDCVIGMDVFDPSAKEEGAVLTVTERGYGKRTAVSEYRPQGRGGKGIINIKTTERNGKVVDICHVLESSEVILITEQGKIIRLEASQIRETVTRSAQGVRLIVLEDNDHVADLTLVTPGLGEENQDG